MLHSHRIATLATALAVLALALPAAAGATVTVTIGDDVFVVDDAIVRETVKNWGTGDVTFTYAHLSDGRSVVGRSDQGVFNTTYGTAWSTSLDPNPSTRPPGSARSDRCMDFRFRGRWFKVTARDCNAARRAGRKVRRRGNVGPPPGRFVVVDRGRRVTFDPNPSRAVEVAQRAAGLVRCGYAYKIGTTIAYSNDAATCGAAVTFAYDFAGTYGMNNPHALQPECSEPVAGGPTQVCRVDGAVFVIEDATSDRQLVSMDVDGTGGFWSPASPLLEALVA